MADTLSESRACALLTRLFKRRGYAIQRDVPFREFGVEFDCDGWDPKARVGFEFLSSQQEDHADLSLDEFETLMEAQERGRLRILILDEAEALSVDELTALATEFLDGPAAEERTATARAGQGRGRAPAAPGKRAAGTRSTKKPAARKAKPAGKKGAATPKRPARADVTRPKAEQSAPRKRVRGTRAVSARAGGGGR